MQINSLTPNHAKRVARSIGRGGKRGKTSGHGGKGQTARAGHKIRPEMRDVVKKFPKRRGYGKNRSDTVRGDRKIYAAINVESLEALFAAGETITPALLMAKGLAHAQKGRAPFVKILGRGTLSKSFTIKNCAVSVSAKAAIEKAGGTIHA